MTPQPTPRLSAMTCALLLACGNGVGADDGASASGAGTSTSITSASASSPDPTTGSSVSAGEGTTAGSASASHSDSSGDEPTHTTSAAGSTSTSDESSTANTSPMSSSDPETSRGDETTAGSLPEPCQVEITQVLPVPPTVLFLLDKSGSMGNLPDYLWDHDDNEQTPKVTRWSSLHAVVESMVVKFNKVVDFGVKLYPKIDATPYKATGACDVDPGVEVEVAPLNGANVLAGIPPADFDVLGGTPMEGGIHEAFNYLTALDPEDQKFILMIADGDISKTCEDQNFLEALQYIESAWQDHNIATYVVGIAIDDPNSKTQLTNLANVGGKPNMNGPYPYYSTQNQLELDEALQQIVDDTLSCTIAVDPEPSYPDLFEVWVDNQEFPAVADCADDGWQWTTPHKEIQLCGEACTQLKKSGKVEARYYCIAM